MLFPKKGSRRIQDYSDPVSARNSACRVRAVIAKKRTAVYAAIIKHIAGTECFPDIFPKEKGAQS